MIPELDRKLPGWTAGCGVKADEVPLVRQNGARDAGTPILPRPEDGVLNAEVRLQPAVGPPESVVWRRQDRRPMSLESDEAWRVLTSVALGQVQKIIGRRQPPWWRVLTGELRVVRT